MKRCALLLTLVAVGCAKAEDNDVVGADTGIASKDSSTADTAPRDSATTDSTVVDSSMSDSTVADSTVLDSTTVDTSDTSVVDTSVPDTSVVDTTVADTTSDGGSIGWSDTASGLTCAIGTRYTYACPASGTAGSLWGSNPYTSDSSICTAGVHAGMISLASGGSVVIELRAGESSYPASTAHGISSGFWGTWSCSYFVVGGGGSDGGVDAAPTTATWGTTASEHRCLVDTVWSYACPASGSAGSVWGTGTYTDDSSICTAAVHAGKISLASGGTVTIQMKAGLSAYTGSTANGITSSTYASWTCSYVFL